MIRDNGVFVRRIGTGVLKDPWDVIVYNGEVFVADFVLSSVSVFSHYGELVHTIGSRGTSWTRTVRGSDRCGHLI